MTTTSSHARVRWSASAVELQSIAAERKTWLHSMATDERKLDATSPDDALVKACIVGDHGAWSILVDRYRRLVYSVPRRYGLGAEDADEVFQDVFLALIRRLESVQNPQGLAKWLMTSAARQSIRVIRQRGSRSLHDGVIPAEPPSFEQLERWERTDELRHALHELGGRCEQLLVALFVGEDRPSYPAIAERLGMPRGSIGPTRARCLEKLLEILDDD